MRKGVITLAMAMAALLIIMVSIMSAAPARADGIRFGSDGRGASIKVSTNGGLGGTSPAVGAAGSGRTCSYTPDADLNAGLAAGEPKTGILRLAAHGTFYDYRCSDGTAGIVYVPDSQAPAAPVFAAQLARQAYRYLPLPAPQVRLNPPAGADQLVNLPTWLWVAPATWGSRSATASVPGLSATVTAVPVSVTWQMGDGGRVTCRGPGTPYDPARPEASQHPSCSYTYRHAADAVAVTATTTWRVTWVAHGVQAGGSMPPLGRTSPATLLRVVEVQAINNNQTSR